jgi:hypothetical protein
MNYVTLQAAKQYMGIEASNTVDDDRIALFCDWATTFIEFYKGRHYDPRYETRVFDKPSPKTSSFGVFESRLQPAAPVSPLRLDEDLLECFALINGDGVAITAYLLEPSNMFPKMRVRLKGGESWVSDDDGNDMQVISLTGLWGSHDKYSLAWVDNGQTVVDNPLSSGATSIVVGAITPFSAGQLIRVDNELMLISAAALVLTVPTLTVERAYNGSTAAAHVAGSKIKVWKLQGNINQACLRMVKWRYNQKDVDAFDKTYSVETGILSSPAAIPTDILAVLGASKVTL